MAEKLIDSFKVNHVKLKPGLYVARTDRDPGQCGVYCGRRGQCRETGPITTTFDLRLVRPVDGKEVKSAIPADVMHTLEHLMAVYLRNHASTEDFRKRVIYVGPMGSRTGMCLVMHGRQNSRKLAKIMIAMCDWILAYEEVIPGAKPKQCGNYQFHDHSPNYRRTKKYVEEWRGVLTRGLKWEWSWDPRFSYPA